MPTGRISGGVTRENSRNSVAIRSRPLTSWTIMSKNSPCSAIRLRRHLFSQKLGRAFDGRQRVSQFMGDVGGKLAGFGQLGNALDFFLHLHFIGDVLEDDDDAEIVAGLAAKLGRAQIDIRLIALRACGNKAGCV